MGRNILSSNTVTELEAKYNKDVLHIKMQTLLHPDADADHADADADADADPPSSSAVNTLMCVTNDASWTGGNRL